MNGYHITKSKQCKEINVVINTFTHCESGIIETKIGEYRLNIDNLTYRQIIEQNITEITIDETKQFNKAMLKMITKTLKTK